MSEEKRDDNLESINQEAFKQYAELKTQAKEIAKKLKEVEPIIKEEMNKLETEKIKTNLGLFYFVNKVKYKYPEEIELWELPKELKEQVDAEYEKYEKRKRFLERKGIAERTIIQVLNFR